jgi:hypothetical protein
MRHLLPLQGYLSLLVHFTDFLCRIIVAVITPLLPPLHLTRHYAFFRRQNNTSLDLLSSHAFAEISIVALRRGIELLLFNLAVNSLLHDSKTPLVGHVIPTVRVRVPLQPDGLEV